VSSSFTFYNSFKKYVFDGTVIPGSDTLKVCLVTDAYTFDATHDVLADVLTSPSPEVEAIASPDNGYTQGGETLAGKVVSLTDSPSQSSLDADDVVWAALTATFRYAIIYAEKSVSPIENPLIACILLDTTPADIVVSGIDYKLQLSTSGLMTLA
jgi:hypothetical protein